MSPLFVHLADLQPTDPVKKFNYSKLAIDLWIGATSGSANIGGAVLLHGSDEHSETVVLPQPASGYGLLPTWKYQ